MIKHRSAPATVDPDRPHAAVGAAFATRLKANGFSQRRFATTLGLALSTVSDWCTGIARVPGYATAYLDLFEAKAKIGENVRAALNTD